MRTASVALSANADLIEWAVRAKALNDASESGDLHVVAPFLQGTLVAAIDGLGHGAEAAIAARAAHMTLAQNAGNSVSNLMQLCHEAIHNTRGAVISLASIRAENNIMTWVGVGNIEAMLFRADKNAQKKRESLLLRGGVVGYRMPPLHETSLPIFPGDTLIFVTDGIKSDFSNKLLLEEPPYGIADNILSCHAKNTDDALVFVVRYLGLQT